MLVFVTKANLLSVGIDSKNYLKKYRNYHVHVRFPGDSNVPGMLWKEPNSLPHFLVSADDAPVLRYE